MKFQLTFANCFWLVLPILAWNLGLGSRITDERITSDAHSPRWLLAGENIFRLAAFILPIFLKMDFSSHIGKAGLVVYGVGILIYFASWLPLIWMPHSTWSQSLPGLFAPRLTPWLALVGIALIGQSWLYALVCTVFIFFHTWHGIQNL